MKTSIKRQASSPPSLISALRGGFDAITNNVVLILFPAALDLFLWLGPHLRLKQLVDSLSSQLVSMYDFQDPGAKEMLQAGQEVWAQVAEQFNLLTSLRSYPVGIPSLMAYLSPIRNPTGLPGGWEIQSIGGALAIWVLVTIFGLVAGTIYFAAVAQAALSGQVQWRWALLQWPWAALQVLLLSLFFLALVIGISIPGSLIISLGALSSLTLGQCAVIMYGVLLTWLFFPLLLSPHGIFVDRQNIFNTLKSSLAVTRATVASTFLFFLTVVLLSRGLDTLWGVPPETSWLMLIGIAGHAFVATSLLASSFVYYQDASQWMKARASRLKVPSPQEPIGEN